MSLLTADFDYELPDELIAQTPLKRRDQSRLMVLRRSSGRVAHRVFGDLPALLRAGDVLVLNDTRVIPARFYCRRATGGRIEGLFVREVSPGRWQVMLRGAERCRAGEMLTLDGAAETRLQLRENLGQGCWQATVRPVGPAVDLLERVGLTPLPPYIRRQGASQEAEDRPRYQTVYAERAGAIAAPTAGLHFTEPLLAELRRGGVELAQVTLHVGLGTFLPVKADSPARHKMHAEWYELSAEAADKLNAARRSGGRVVAVGTTSARLLESVARDRAPHGAGQFLRPAGGWTDLFIYPPAEFLAVDTLITNFHLPRSTLLMLVAAFCSPGETEGIEMILNAYAEAVRLAYRFYSYGDAMMID